jgi:hypothetical protein
MSLLKTNLQNDTGSQWGDGIHFKKFILETITLSEKNYMRNKKFGNHIVKFYAHKATD